MKKFFNIFFVTLGIIFFIIILIGTYLFVADPFGLKPMLFKENVEKVGKSENSTTPSTGDSVENGAVPPGEESSDKDQSVFSEKQEKALEVIGIDPNSIPTEFTGEQIACFESILGGARVAEIKAGDSPTPMEYLKAKDCVN